MNGTFEDIDQYIDCKNSIQIFYYGSSILETYIPSLSRGRNIVKLIYSQLINPDNTEIVKTVMKRDGKEVIRETIQIKDMELYKKELKEGNIIFDYTETDSEVLFHFKYKNYEELIPYFPAKESCLNRSPYSTKNLPKTKYNIPENELNTYKEITSIIPKNEILKISHITKSFLKTLCNKRNTEEKLKEDMRLKGLSGKDYIHSIGKWNEYMKYLKAEMENI